MLRGEQVAIAHAAPWLQNASAEVDDRTFRITGINPVPHVPAMMTYQAVVPAPKALAEKNKQHWADTLEGTGLVKLATYRGKDGMTTLLPRLAVDNAGLVTIYCDNGSAYLQFWRSVFERRAPRSLPGHGRQNPQRQSCVRTSLTPTADRASVPRPSSLSN